jgi:hypothetical protein
MEKYKQPQIIQVDPTRTLEETFILIIEAWNVLQALPSYVEENARIVRQETLEEFIISFSCRLS